MVTYNKLCWNRMRKMIAFALTMAVFVLHLTAVVLSITGFVFNMPWLVLTITRFSLNMIGFSRNMTVGVLSMTELVLSMTRFVQNMAGFQFNGTGFDDYDDGLNGMAYLTVLVIPCLIWIEHVTIWNFLTLCSCWLLNSKDPGLHSQDSWSSSRTKGKWSPWPAMWLFLSEMHTGT